MIKIITSSVFFLILCESKATKNVEWATNNNGDCGQFQGRDGRSYPTRRCNYNNGQNYISNKGGELGDDGQQSWRRKRLSSSETEEEGLQLMFIDTEQKKEMPLVNETGTSSLTEKGNIITTAVRLDSLGESENKNNVRETITNDDLKLSSKGLGINSVLENMLDNFQDKRIDKHLKGINKKVEEEIKPVTKNPISDPTGESTNNNTLSTELEKNRLETKLNVGKKRQFILTTTERSDETQQRETPVRQLNLILSNNDDEETTIVTSTNEIDIEPISVPDLRESITIEQNKSESTTETFDLTTTINPITRTDEKIVVALIELENLRGKEQNVKTDIQDAIDELEKLIDEEEIEELDTLLDDEESSLRLQKFLMDSKNVTELPRESKSIGQTELVTLGRKVNSITATINVFENLQKQIFNLLNQRQIFLDALSDRISSELDTIKQTVNFLKGIVDFKLDQSELLLGEMNPIIDLLQSGSTSIFLVITRFFEGIESVLSMKEQFLRSFILDSTDIREANLLDRIKDLKLNTILPTKMRILLNLHARSDRIGGIVREIFQCVKELVDAKRDLISAIGHFVEDSIELISGLAGPLLTVPTLVTAVRTGNLYRLLNFGPISQRGIPLLSDGALDEMVEELVGNSDLESPAFGIPIKPVLVNNRQLGTLAGPNRERLVNRLLARSLSTFLKNSQSEVLILQGESIMKAWFPPLQLGTPCTNEVSFGRSHGSIVVNRNSRFSALGGIRINSHSPPSKDIIGSAWLHVDMSLAGSVRTSIGQEIFGKCFNKFTGSSPVQMTGKGYGTMYAKVLVSNVKLEKRPTHLNPVLGQLGFGVDDGAERLHLVFTFNIKVDGQLNDVDLSSLKLSGCKFRVLGIKMFSKCGLLESIIRRQVEKATNDIFPLSGRNMLRGLENAIKMRFGDEIAIPIGVQDGPNLEPADRVVRKTRRLLDLNFQLLQSLTSLNEEMEGVNTE